MGGHYHIAGPPIVVIRRRICIGFAFGQESRSPHFVLRRRMADSSCSFPRLVRAEPGLAEAGPRLPSSRSVLEEGSQDVAAVFIRILESRGGLNFNSTPRCSAFVLDPFKADGWLSFPRPNGVLCGGRKMKTRRNVARGFSIHRHL